MLSKLFFSIVVVFFVIQNLHSQLLNNQQKSEISNTIRTQFTDIADNFKYNYSKNNFCVVNKDTLYNPNGFHYVFKLKNGIAERMDISHFHGGNFNRYLFEWKKQLFTIGGYGFFTTHNNLQFFNSPLHEWTYKSTAGNQPRHIMGLIFKHKNKLFSFNNFKSGNATSKDIYDDKLYVLGLNNMNWKVFNLMDKNIKFIGVNYHLNDYHLFIGKINSILLEPNSLKYILLKNEEVGLLENGSISKIDGNSLFIESKGSAEINKLSTEVDLDKIWNTNFGKIKKLDFYDINNSNKEPLKYYLIGIFLIIILVIIGFFVFKIKFNKSKNKDLFNQNFTEIHQRLYTHKNKSFTIDELDAVLGIDHLETDSKKLKRHRIINDLNQSHTNFIERTKDKNDKRKYIYIINK